LDCQFFINLLHFKHFCQFSKSFKLQIYGFGITPYFFAGFFFKWTFWFVVTLFFAVNFYILHATDVDKLSFATLSIFLGGNCFFGF